jgi:hypothetical protein
MIEDTRIYEPKVSRSATVAIAESRRSSDYEIYRPDQFRESAGPVQFGIDEARVSDRQDSGSR